MPRFKELIAEAKKICFGDDSWVERDERASYKNLLDYSNQRNHHQINRLMIKDILDILESAEIIEHNKIPDIPMENMSGIERFLFNLNQRDLRVGDQKEKTINGQEIIWISYDKAVVLFDNFDSEAKENIINFFRSSGKEPLFFDSDKSEEFFTRYESHFV